MEIVSAVDFCLLQFSHEHTQKVQSKEGVFITETLESNIFISLCLKAQFHFL